MQRNQRSNCQHLLDHKKSKRVPEKHLLLPYLLCQILWLCGSQQTVENSERYRNTRPPEIPPDKPGYGRTDWVQIEKEYVKAVYCHPTYLTSMWSSSWEMLDWKKHKLESRFLGEISITSDMKMTAHLRQKVKKTKELLDKSERGEWKSWLKAQHSEN